MANRSGRFVWHDLMTTDPEGAKAFYPKLTGWNTMPFPGDPNYVMWANGESPLGGIMELPQEARDMGAPTHWLAYVHVDDCDAVAAKVTEHGGRVYKAPFDIPNVGRCAIFADPDGAVFAAFTPGNPEDKAPAGEPGFGEFSWRELMANNYENSWRFYSAIFDWDHVSSMDMGEAGTYFLYGHGETMLGGMMNKPPMVPVANWLHYIKVPKLDEALSAVKANGGQVLNGPMEIPGGEFVAQCMDPQGGSFALHAPVR